MSRRDHRSVRVLFPILILFLSSVSSKLLLSQPQRINESIHEKIARTQRALVAHIFFHKTINQRSAISQIKTSLRELGGSTQKRAQFYNKMRDLLLGRTSVVSPGTSINFFSRLDQPIRLLSSPTKNGTYRPYEVKPGQNNYFNGLEYYVKLSPDSTPFQMKQGGYYAIYYPFQIKGKRGSNVTISQVTYGINQPGLLEAVVDIFDIALIMYPNDTNIILNTLNNGLKSQVTSDRTGTVRILNQWVKKHEKRKRFTIIPALKQQTQLLSLARNHYSTSTHQDRVHALSLLETIDPQFNRLKATVEQSGNSPVLDLSIFKLKGDNKTLSYSLIYDYLQHPLFVNNPQHRKKLLNFAYQKLTKDRHTRKTMPALAELTDLLIAKASSSELTPLFKIKIQLDSAETVVGNFIDYYDQLKKATSETQRTILQSKLNSSYLALMALAPADAILKNWAGLLSRVITEGNRGPDVIDRLLARAVQLALRTSNGSHLLDRTLRKWALDLEKDQGPVEDEYLLIRLERVQNTLSASDQSHFEDLIDGAVYNRSPQSAQDNACGLLNKLVQNASAWATKAERERFRPDWLLKNEHPTWDFAIQALHLFFFVKASVYSEKAVDFVKSYGFVGDSSNGLAKFIDKFKASQNAAQVKKTIPLNPLFLYSNTFFNLTLRELAGKKNEYLGNDPKNSIMPWLMNTTQELFEKDFNSTLARIPKTKAEKRAEASGASFNWYAFATSVLSLKKPDPGLISMFDTVEDEVRRYVHDGGVQTRGLPYYIYGPVTRYRDAIPRAMTFYVTRFFKEKDHPKKQSFQDKMISALLDYKDILFSLRLSLRRKSLTDSQVHLACASSKYHRKPDCYTPYQLYSTIPYYTAAVEYALNKLFLSPTQENSLKEASKRGLEILKKLFIPNLNRFHEEGVPTTDLASRPYINPLAGIALIPYINQCETKTTGRTLQLNKSFGILDPVI